MIRKIINNLPIIFLGIALLAVTICYFKSDELAEVIRNPYQLMVYNSEQKDLIMKFRFDNEIQEVLFRDDNNKNYTQYMRDDDPEIKESTYTFIQLPKGTYYFKVKLGPNTKVQYWDPNAKAKNDRY